MLTPPCPSKLLQLFKLKNFRFIIHSCRTKNHWQASFRGHPSTNRGETAATEYIEKIEVALDSYVKAQTSAPEVVKRINELENCLQRLANAAFASGNIDKRPQLRAAAEEAKLLLKNRLEVDDTKHRFHSELGLVKDESRIIED